MKRWHSRLFFLTVALAVLAGVSGRSPKPAEAQLLSSPLVVTRTIVGTVGGSVANGRWTVYVPAGAYPGTGDVSVGVASASGTECELGIRPAALNRFATPVTVTAQFALGTDLTGCVIECYEPATNRWVAVSGSAVDAQRARVTACLRHFSTYRVSGKSGW